MEDIRLAVLMTCHNRRDDTLKCLGYLDSQMLPSTTSVDVFLVDAGSTDGTAEAVKKQFSNVQLLSRDASVYWAQGMRIAFRSAMDSRYDFYLWVNDDTRLDPDAISRLLSTYHNIAATHSSDSIVVGSIRDPETGELTYGGNLRAPGLHPLKFHRAPVSGTPTEVDTMNGNCVLIPDSVARLVGNIDPAFAHSFGDFDYGLRARRLGCAVWVAPGTLGVCSQNDAEGTWRDPQLPLSLRLRKMRGPKGIPFAEWKVFTRRHGGVLWPVFWASPYIKLFVSAMLKRNAVAR